MGSGTADDDGNYRIEIAPRSSHTRRELECHSSRLCWQEKKDYRSGATTVVEPADNRENKQQHQRLILLVLVIRQSAEQNRFQQ